MTDDRTTELREKLTELDVKWWPMRNNGYYEDRDTEFVVNGKKHTAHEWGDGLAVYNLTPEQAIAATLGNGTCEIVLGEDDYGCDAMVCSKCFKKIDDACSPNYCPNCDAKVVKR